VAYSVNPICIRLWFCAAVAVIAAAVADPMLEFASNHGWFGPGTFTDHSNLDVLPSLAFGMFFAALCLVMRARAALDTRQGFPHGNLLQATRRALKARPSALLAVAFPLQLAVLYTMESVEQLAVYRHELGGTIWMGAPVGIALTVHAMVCVLVAWMVAATVRSLSAVTVRLIRRFTAHRRVTPQLVLNRRASCALARISAPVLCRIGERAPPLLQA
jgi:hypothetical protein